MATTQKFASTCFFLLLCLSFSFAHRVLLNDDNDGKVKADSVDVNNDGKEKIDSANVNNDGKEKIDVVGMMIEKAAGNGSGTGTGFASGGAGFGSGNGTGSAGGMGTRTGTGYGTGTGSGVCNASACEIDAAQPLNGGEIELMPTPQNGGGIELTPMPKNPLSNSSNLTLGGDGSQV